MFERGDMAICGGGKVNLVQKSKMETKGLTHSDLLQIKEILERGNFTKKNTVRDGVGGEESSGEMISVSSFSGVRPQPERV